MVGRPLALLMILAVVLSGCSDGGGTADSSPTTTPGPDDATASPPSSTAPPSASNSTSPSPTASPRPARTFDVTIQGSDFVDGSITVQKGDTVRWTQKDANRHTVTADDGSFASGDLLPLPSQDTFTHVFDATGTFPYHCAYHGSMTDAITVVEALPA